MPSEEQCAPASEPSQLDALPNPAVAGDQMGQILALLQGLQAQSQALQVQSQSQGQP